MNFTWNRGTLFKRLDRAISNDEWLWIFPEATVLHLPKINSDHRPILICYRRDSDSRQNPKPFCLMVSWLTDAKFKEFFSKCWNSKIYFIISTKEFAEKVSRWNKEVFGGIFKRERILLARLYAIQQALENHKSRRLFELEEKLE